jgi:hypothetical protein
MFFDALLDGEKKPYCAAYLDNATAKVLFDRLVKKP